MSSASGGEERSMQKKRRRAVHEHKAADSDVFLRSLDEITPEQIAGEGARVKRTGGELLSFLIERAVYLFAVAVFVVCVVELAISLGGQIAGDMFYDSVAEKWSASDMISGLNGQASGAGAAASGVPAMSASGSSEPFVAGVSQPIMGVTAEMREKNETVERMKASIASMQHQYPDVYGWIYIEDTKIDYPVVRGSDNDYYLSHAFTGEPQSVGSIFADYSLKDYILDNYNTVFYGHNSSTGKMFADVMKFALSEEFFKTHNIYVWTSTGLYEFEPFNLAMFEYDYQYFRTRFSGPEAFLEFVNEMKQGSIFKKDLDFDEDDRILTLSTCTKTGIKSKRYCLQAKLIRVME